MKTVTIRNTGNGPVLVGHRYLLPGEQREVPAVHLERAAGKKWLQVIEAESPAAETAAVEEAAQVEEKPKRRSSRGAK